MPGLSRAPLYAQLMSGFGKYLLTPEFPTCGFGYLGLTVDGTKFCALRPMTRV